MLLINQQILIKLDQITYLFFWMIKVIYHLFQVKSINMQIFTLDNINSKIVQIFIHQSNEDQNLNFISIDNTETKEITDLGKDSDTTYAAFYFRKSPITILVERKNQSVIDLISKLGGLLQISFIVMGFIISAYNKITMLIELSNKIYEFSPNIEQQNKQHQDNLKLIDNVYEDKQLLQDYYVNREGQYRIIIRFSFFILLQIQYKRNEKLQIYCNNRFPIAKSNIKVKFQDFLEKVNLKNIQF